VGSRRGCCNLEPDEEGDGDDGESHFGWVVVLGFDLAEDFGDMENVENKAILWGCSGLCAESLGLRR
jgi:hypothetical protein